MSLDLEYHDSPRLVRRLWRDYLRAHLGKVVFATVCMVIVAAVTAANAWMLEPVFDYIFVNRDESMLTLLPIIVVALAILKAAASYGQGLVMRSVGQRIMCGMQLDLYKHLVHADLALFHSHGAGSLISRFTNDIAMMREALSSVLTSMVREALTLVFLLAVMFSQSWKLALIASILFPVAIYPISRLGKRMRKISGQTQHNLGRFTARLDQTFQGIRILKAYGQEAREIESAREALDDVYELYVKGFRVKAAASPVMEMLAGIAVAMVIWYGGAQVLAGETSPGAFVSFIAAVIMAYKPAKSVAGLNTQLQEGLAATARLYAVLDTPPDITEREQAKTLPRVPGNIRVESASFHYPGREADAAALDNVSLEIPAGKLVALVGPSGGGKSTLMNLLLRFYDVESGRITLEGEDLRDVTLASLRDQFALVSQDAVLFDDTVAANIRYGRLNASDEEVEAAAKAAAAHEFISELPEGYATRIGPSGASLSGGQRQRIAIARAILKDAPILLLDEATSALDTRSEQQVQQALETLMNGRTALVIAHRLSTVQHADVIYVLDHGRVVESGTHDALHKAGGLYTALCAGQLQAPRPAVQDEPVSA